MRHAVILSRWPWNLAAAALIVGMIAGGLLAFAPQSDPANEERFGVVPVAFQLQGRRAPGLEKAVGWINTSGPIHLEDLRGKIVLLDFWTYCCINCHHILPDLAKLEQKYKNELVIIGIHTAKFPAERDTENIRKKVREYRIEHPVANDANQAIWNDYQIGSWPSLVFIGPDGHLIADPIPGEVHFAALDKIMGELVLRYKGHGLTESPLVFPHEKDKPQNTPLLYPGKVLADEAGNRLFVSDTGNNRIVMADLTGKTLSVIGNGDAGLGDGSFDKATFNRPQGICLVGETLYVADTENHAIRAVDLKSQRVETIAGTGEQSSRNPKLRFRGPAKSSALSSPWDVLPIPGSPNVLAIAMAGMHELWKLDLESGTIGVWAGSGEENVVDADFSSACFAQPSGLATDGKHLFVADSEGSAVREMPLGRVGRVQTIAGTHDIPLGQSLFAFGDLDGKGPRARLQHCLGLAFADGKLYVADSYNNKIKVCTPATRLVQTFVGSRAAGESDDPPRFDEPGGLSIAGSSLYVADTNNHAVRVIDLKTRKVTTLAMAGLKPPTPPVRVPRFPKPLVIDLPATPVAPGKGFTIDVALDVPAGFKLNAESPMPYLVETPGQAGVLGEGAPPTGLRVEPPSAKFTVDVPLAKPAEAGQQFPIKLSVAAFVCQGEQKYCTVKNFVWNIPVTFADGAPDRVAVTNAAQPTATP